MVSARSSCMPVRMRTTSLPALSPSWSHELLELQLSSIEVASSHWSWNPNNTQLELLLQSRLTPTCWSTPTRGAHRTAPRPSHAQAVLFFVRSVLRSPNKEHVVQLRAYMQGDMLARTSSVGYALLVARLAHSIWLPSLKCTEVLYAYAERAGQRDDGDGMPKAEPAQQV